MSNRSASEKAKLERLRTQYRDAFERWATEVARLQDQEKCAERRQSAAAPEQTAALAETNYRIIRDQLAASLMTPGAMPRHV